MTRRDMIAGIAACPLLLQAQPPQSPKISVFSKHLQFLEGEALVDAVQSLGFDGIDLAVRKGGHIEPARVKTELPRLAALCRRRKIDIPMLTTDIVDATTPYAEEILGTMEDLGIRYYRWGGFVWTGAKPYARQIDDFKPRVEKLAALNAKHQVSAMYHTHSGVGIVGASIWDLHEILTGFDPKLVGINYDIGHATVEGGFGGWMNSYRIAAEYIRGIAIKDFVWEKNTKGEYKVAWKPLGEGMVKLKQFVGMVRSSNFEGPLQMHFEYPLGGADNGSRNPAMPKEQIFAAMQRDLRALRALFGAPS